MAEIADAARLNCSARLRAERRVELGQFFTPSIVGRFMASMFTPRRRVRLLDPGAGVGSLTAAFVETAMTWSERPVEIEVAAFEADDQVLSPLRSTLAACRRACRDNGVRFSARVIADDFIHAAVASLDEGLLRVPAIPPFDAVIMNPPYRKIRSSSRERTTLRRIGVETCNLYSAFLALAGRLLRSGGELVAITPRSFCNGPYFRPFRESFFAEMTLHRAHVFERRDRAFRDDDVLQENIVFHAVREHREPESVVVSTSACPSSESITVRRLRAAEVLDRLVAGVVRA